jgi:histone H3/H4
MVSREAVLLISLATEEFVKRISEASHRLAQRENRMTVQRKDIGAFTPSCVLVPAERLTDDYANGL